MEYINFTKISVTDEIFKNRIDVISKVSIVHAIEKLYETPRIKNFLNAKKAIAGDSDAKFKGITFDDSDVYKVLEGASYILSQNYSEELDSEVDKIIQMIGDAQEEDGYIVTRHIIHPELRWVCMDAHELYNMGLLIEAGIAHYHATKKKTLLEIAIKAANNVCSNVELNNKWVPGHEEIEMALIKLYEFTGDERYLNQAEQFLFNRGRNFGIKNGDYSLSGEANGFDGTYSGYWDKEYYQDNRPVEYLSEVQGHAVRAMYLYTGMAMLSKYRDKNYLPALNDIWKNLMGKKAYVTGGIGSSRHNEGFTEEYDLPNLTAYCETCASVGMVYWNSEMYLESQNTKFLDVIDKEIKNGIICGLSADGTKFSYDNPLSSNGNFERSEWFETSCCPTQSLRFISSLPKYIYAIDEKNFYINLMISSNYTDGENKLKLEVNDKNITINTNMNCNLKIRIPEYYVICGSNHEFEFKNGFVEIKSTNKPIIIEIQKTIQFIHANENIQVNNNKVAVKFDGYIYCAEEYDNPGIEKLKLMPGLNYIVSNKTIRDVNFKSITALDNRGNVVVELIPYFLWNNRGKGKMDVWITNNKNNLYNI